MFSCLYIIFSDSAIGYSYHGDFQNGWNISLLQDAISTCTNLSGKLADCSAFATQIQEQYAASTCSLATPDLLAKDDCVGPRLGLCSDVRV